MAKLFANSGAPDQMPHSVEGFQTEIGYETAALMNRNLATH